MNKHHGIACLLLIILIFNGNFGYEQSPSMNCAFYRWRRGLRFDFCPKDWNLLTECGFLTNSKEKSLHSFDAWRLSDSLLLSSGFKIDAVTKNYVREVRNAIFSKVNPTPLKTEPKLVAVSQEVLENILELNVTSCENSKDFIDFVSGNRILEGSIPLAHRWYPYMESSQFRLPRFTPFPARSDFTPRQRLSETYASASTYGYGGHQFGSWADQLGDGRAHLLGEFVNEKNERWELQLKGSGLTPYSRRGDGRAVLRSSVREFLCSEALHHLGIPTSRAASLVVSEDAVIRDQFYNGNIKSERAAVVLRVAPSWFRIGSLEILTENGEIDLLRHLVDFIILNYFKDEVDLEDSERYVHFYDAVVNRTIKTVVKWMNVGFTHGVCNTDNFSLLGLTIDYGPFGFVEEYDPNFVPNTSDDQGRYSLEKQPSVAMFNMDKLRIALSPLLDKKRGKTAKKILKSFNDRYQTLLMKEFRKKLGLFNEFEKDSMLIASLLYLMEETESDFTMTFRQLGELSMEDMQRGTVSSRLWSIRDLQKHKLFPNWLESYHKRLVGNPKYISDDIRRQKMNAVNPRYILRNWMAEQAIRKATEDDYSEVTKLMKILSDPFTEQPIAEDSGFSDRSPEWSKKLRVSCSS